MRRVSLNLVAAVSAALFVALVAGWLRSGWARDSAQWGRAGRTIYVASDSGILLFQWITHRQGAWQDRMWFRSDPSGVRTHGLNLRRAFLRFDAGFEERSGNGSVVVTWFVVAPHWAAAIVAAVVPAWWLWRRRLARRHALGV